ncbi:hypothetical protein OROHE_027118 [Orobanche hederae]
MSEVKDPKIKLFGKTIELPETFEAAGISEQAAKENSSTQIPTFSSNHYSVLEYSSSNGDETEVQQPQQSESRSVKDDAIDPSLSNELEDSNTPSPLVDSPKEDVNESSNSHDKTLKKPDKILPCPRCNSMDTKFCYFNNYNVNQPRHFCKNCQRYWTAGGTMRNVPVGAGRRKNKNVITSQFRPLTIPEASQLNPNGTLLAFNTDTHMPPCESTVSVLNIADKTVRSEENHVDDCASDPSVSNLKDEVPVFCGGAWSYPCHNFVQWSSPISHPTFSPASFSVPFYPTPPPYWAGPNTWNGPLVIPLTPDPGTGLISPTLGKHPRDENIPKPANSGSEIMQTENNDSGQCLWAPKTSRIDDHGELARSSSVWAALGMKNDTGDDDCVGVGKGSLFKAFQRQSKDVKKTRIQENSTVLLQANPAALSRSMSVHESS